ncbi:hypothetical protein ACFY9R_26555 [Streptomyces albidoflavus]|uniref:hypothetical protein n=1 Tax=Streptomyces albidoflavus TaxID=1886 RepID=UPI0033EF7A80
MARTHADGPRVYRAVIAYTYANGRVVTKKRGPYDTTAPAKGAITSAQYQAEQSRGKWSDPSGAFTVSAHIESAVIDWQKDQTP